ncbi:MAG: leucine-rich repeat domain-containing protein [Alphaproteobacteria bacterium]|nr:leucine-rich repeat domain-containing protein [Alphaproteobacteria bacterium]
MKKTVLILGILSSFNANAWEPCGTDAEGNTANCEYQIIDGTLTIRGVGNNGNIGSWYDSSSGRGISPWIDKDVKNIVLEDSVKDLGSHGFYTLTAPIKLPNSITEIPKSAFDHYYGNTLDIPDSVTSIGYMALRGMRYLKNIVVPDNVTLVDDYAFSLNLDLETLTISDKTDLKDIFKQHRVDTVATNTQNLKIYCTGDTKKCDDHLKAAGYPELKSIKATTKHVNGVTYVFDNKGKLVTTSGRRENKRIYSIEEASLVSKKTGNTFKLRYK